MVQPLDRLRGWEPPRRAGDRAAKPDLQRGCFSLGVVCVSVSPLLPTLCVNVHRCERVGVKPPGIGPTGQRGRCCSPGRTGAPVCTRPSWPLGPHCLLWHSGGAPTSGACTGGQQRGVIEREEVPRLCGGRRTMGKLQVGIWTWVPQSHLYWALGGACLPWWGGAHPPGQSQS